MKKKVKILFTDLAYLNHNYGAQGIGFPLIEKLDKHFDGEYTFVLPERYYEEDLPLSKKYAFNIIPRPRLSALLGRYNFIIYFVYNLFSLLKKGKSLTKKEARQYSDLVKKLKECDVVIDLCGIELIGNHIFTRRWSNYISTTYMQCLAAKYNKPYLKFTKSYGPFPYKIHRFFVKRHLNKLPVVFVRGKRNLEIVKRLNLKVPIYSFPDISIALKAESRNWAIAYIDKLKLDFSIPILGLSPSSVICGLSAPSDNSTAGLNHVELCKKIIEFFQSRGQQILLIPHSIGNGKDWKTCDLALSKKIFHELPNKENVFIIRDTTLTYKQIKGIIGLLDFYITGRYHSVTSAFSTGIPLVSLSWHIKYSDIMALFLDDFLAIDCRTVGPEESLSLIKRYHSNRQWFDRDEVLQRKEKAVESIDKNIEILVNQIEKHIGGNKER